MSTVQDCVLPVCPEHHGLCAYHGDEPDRCPWCHATWRSILLRMARGGRHSCEVAQTWHSKDRKWRVAEARQMRLDATGKSQDGVSSTHCAHRYSDKGRARWSRLSTAGAA